MRTSSPKYGRRKKSKGAKYEALVKMRELVFGEEAGGDIWTGSRGFSRFPRSFSLAVAVLHNITKGKRAESVLTALWCRDWVQAGIVEIDLQNLAIEAGYWSSRGSTTVRERLDLLQEHGFIKIAEKGSRSYGWAFLLDPHRVIARLYIDKKITEERWLDILFRLNEVGINMADILDSEREIYPPTEEE